MRRLVPAAIALCFAAAGHAQTIEPPATAQSRIDRVAGLYDGGQMEIAASLELGRDGRYRYQLSYGALDEWSAGTWALADDAIVLTSDAFNAPRFEVQADAAQEGKLAVRMATSSSIDPRYFAVMLTRASGAAAIESMSGDELVIAMGADPVVSLRPILPVFDLSGSAFQVPAAGATLRISFAPNDLGFVGFDQKSLIRAGHTYDLVRHGRTLRFRKVDQTE